MKKLTVPFVFLVWCLGLTAQAADLPASIIQSRPSSAPPLSVPAFSKISTTLQEKGTARVIVRIAAPSDMPAGFAAEQSLQGPTAVGVQRAAIAKAQENVLSRVSQKHAASAKRFRFIPFMALEVDQDDFLALTSSPEIDYIEEDVPVPPMLYDSVPLIGGVNGAFNGYTGNGQTVAILDTGVDKTHSFLTGKVVAEACYSTTSGTTSTAVCTDGSTAPGSGLNCDTSITACGHGTHVAGIVAGQNGTFSGVAKDATLIAIQVFSKFSATYPACGGSPCVLTYTSDQISGLEHVYDLKDTYNISSVNMSLGGGQYFDYCDSAKSSTKSAIDALRSVGIATVIASGNESFTDSISAPACISTAVSVGATTKSDLVASYSNSAEILKLLAPGSSIYSSLPGNIFQSWSGTSMATPHVAGAWAVLKSVRPNASVSKILNALTVTGVPITDTRNSIIKPRIQLDDAVQLLKSRPPRVDFDGDDKADIAVWRPEAGSWFIKPSSGAASYSSAWGTSGDLPVAADYDGDGKTDLAVWRSTEGNWFITGSFAGSTQIVNYGAEGDKPVPGDYDGDGKTDIAVWRPASGAWFIKNSLDGTQTVVSYGTIGDIPIPGDYDGDNKTDIAVWRPSSGIWYIRNSSNGSQTTKNYGASGDTPIPGDYDFDGKTDLALWRNGAWFIMNSASGTQTVVSYGASSDIPVPADYDGDGKIDIAVWRPSAGIWFIKDSSTGVARTVLWGAATDQPIN